MAGISVINWIGISQSLTCIIVGWDYAGWVMGDARLSLKSNLCQNKQFSFGCCRNEGCEETIDYELILKDLEAVEKKLDKVKRAAATGDKEAKKSQEVFPVL